MTAPRPPRLQALDAWRGLTVLLMLLVNNASLGDQTPLQLQHAPFGGLTLTDLVFPWFLFCAGAAIPFSRAAREGGRGGRVGQLLQRAARLYLLGAFVTSAVQRAPTLGLGVLQLIALATLAGSLLAGRRPLLQGLTAAALLLGYGYLLRYGWNGEGTGILSEAVQPIAPLNTWLSGWGLRGLVSVVPASALVLLGSLAAQPLQRRSPRLVPALLGLGLGLAALGYGLAAWGMLPFSKTLWTPPYVLYSAGLGTLGLLLMYLLTDFPAAGGGLGGQFLAPLTLVGRNALAAYVLPILFKVWILQTWRVAWAGGTSLPLGEALLTLARQHWGGVMGGWVYMLGYVLTVWLALAWMSRRRLIWKM